MYNDVYMYNRMTNWMFSGGNSHLWELGGHEFLDIINSLEGDMYAQSPTDGEIDKGTDESVKD